MNVLEQMVIESRGMLVVGIGRWHFRSVGQEDYYNAYYGNLVLLQPHVTKENADFQALADDDPRKTAEWIKILKKMQGSEQQQLATYQRVTVSAGLEGVSESAELCVVAESLKKDPGTAEAVAAMVQAEADYDLATEPLAIKDAQARYQKAQLDVDRFVLERHRCGTACFPSYRAIKFVPKKEDERPADNLIHISTIPPPTVTKLFAAIMDLSDEGGRASKRIADFRPHVEAGPRRNRAQVREAAKRAQKRPQP